MLERLRTLIQEVYVGKLRQKESEMKALQAQINPHFLYNTLSLINWKALAAGETDISKMTLAMSTFYRTALNRGKNTLSVEDELKNTRAYLEIQSMMHDGDFDYTIDAEAEILSCQSLNLILQPLVENAIMHGIEMCIRDRFEGMDVPKQVREDFLSAAGKGELCVVENKGVKAVVDRLEKLIVFRWNRKYPADFWLDADLRDWKLIEAEEFPGNSHEKITQETYVKK